jgi:predicted dehydrogenase
VSKRPLRLAMVGGGKDAFIGAVHRMAAALDGEYVLVAGALSSSPEKSVESGLALGLARERSYPTWPDLIKGELARPSGERVDVVSIVTPNSSHFEVAMGCVGAGLNVICDKPLVVNSGQAETLVAAVKKAGVKFGVTYNYSGYPLVRHASAMVERGELGEIRKVFAEYHQGWLATSLEKDGQKQAAWRHDPKLAGAGGAIGDIGTHAENLIATITGLEIESLCADLTSFGPGRKLDDDASVLLRFRGGAKGVLTASQICIGEQNNLTIRVHGTKGSLSWRQEEPNAMTWHKLDGTTQVLSRAGSGLDERAVKATRLPGGHPEAFIEAFANIYRGVAAAVRGEKGEFPGVEDGARGVRFIERVVESSGTWVKF